MPDNYAETMADARKELILNYLTGDEFSFCLKCGFREDELFQRIKVLTEINYVDHTELLPILLNEASDKVRAQVFSGKTFLHSKFADWLIEAYHITKLRNVSSKSVIHVYQNGIYSQGREVIEGAMDEVLPELKMSHRKETFATLNIRKTVPTKDRSKPYYIPLKSNIYDVISNKFIPYSPDFVFLNRFPYDYIPNAEPQERITNFFDLFTDFDLQVQELLFEFIGSCLFLENKYRGSLFMVGPAKNGKSTFTNLVERLIGSDNCKAFRVDELSDKFHVGALYGKALAFADDMEDKFVTSSSLFKTAVTGGKLKFEAKGEMPWEFIPYNKFMFAMNELPNFSDRTEGLYSRIIILPLTHNFQPEGTKPDTSFLNGEIWTDAEMQYLMRLAIEGLQRLITNGDFTKPEICVKAMEEFKKQNDPTREFLDEKYPSSDDMDDATVAEVYLDYLSWMNATGHKKPLTSKGLSKSIRKIYPDLITEKARNAKSGKTVTIFRQMRYHK